MRKHRRAAAPVVAPPAESRLSGIPRIALDEDERPSREDRDYGQTIFTRTPAAVLPRFLKGRKK